MRNKLLLILFLVLMTSTVTAFQSSINTVEEVAGPDSSAQFQVLIENDDFENHTYSTSLLSPKSSWFYYPNTVKVPARSNKTFNVTVSPVQDALQQRYSFRMKLREKETGQIQEMTGYFRVEQPYRFDIINYNTEKTEYNPGEVVNTEIRLRNLDNQPITDYTITANYMNSSQDKSGAQILPGGERIFKYSFRTSKDAKPGQKQIRFDITSEGEIQRQATDSIQIKKVENISRSSNSENKIITVSETKKAENKGNSPANVTLTAEVPSYLSSITTTSPEADSMEEAEGSTVYTWRTSLQPDESVSVSHKTRYWIPFTGLILLTLGIVALKKIGSTVTVSKTVREEKGEVKVEINLKNSGNETYDDLELEEFIPDIATVQEHFDMNTPKIRKTSEGTKMTWSIQDFEPGDQRVIQYTIKPKVQVEEEVTLKPATLKNRDGEKIAQSNQAETNFTPDTT